LKEASLRGVGRDFETVYFGGGTPSRLGVGDIGKLIERFASSNTQEISLEANPEDISPDTLKQLADVGVTRISLGVQSFDHAVLKFFGRNHDVSDAMRACDDINSNGSFSFNLDLIYGSPNENLSSWQHTLEVALSFSPNHMSLYALTIEPGTRLRNVVLSDEDLAAKYRFADELLHERGLNWYEISNWASPGHQCQHNLGYWLGHDYLGLGPSAVGRVAEIRRKNVSSYQRYLRRIRAGLDPVETVEVLDEEELAFERSYLRFRTRLGIELLRVPDWLLPFVEEENGKLIADIEGRLRLDEIFARIAAEDLIARKSLA
jgi:oxygen-independent coproporphyrinogen-3 oxidase